MSVLSLVNKCDGKMCPNYGIFVIFTQEPIFEKKIDTSIFGILVASELVSAFKRNASMNRNIS